MYTGVISRGIKRRGDEDFRSPSSTVEVENKWSCTLLRLYAIMAWTGTTFSLTFAEEVLFNSVLQILHQTSSGDLTSYPYLQMNLQQK
jgi:hypothetical protein